MYDSVSIATPETSGDELSESKQEELIDEHVHNSGTSSPASAAVSEHQLTGTKESSGPQNLENCADVGLVRVNSQSYNPSESQQLQPPMFSVSTINKFDKSFMLFHWVCFCLEYLFLFCKLNHMGGISHKIPELCIIMFY